MVGGTRAIEGISNGMTLEPRMKCIQNSLEHFMLLWLGFRIHSRQKCDGANCMYDETGIESRNEVTIEIHRTHNYDYAIYIEIYRNIYV